MTNESQNATRLRVRHQVALALQSMKPKLFDFKKPTPLAIGIHEQIRDALPDISHKELFWFLVWWCHRHPYLHALAKENSYRYHLNGRRGTKVTDEHRQFATEAIQEKHRRKAIKKQNKLLATS